MSDGILFLIGLTVVLLVVLAIVVVVLRFDERKNRTPQIAAFSRQVLDAAKRAHQDVARFESTVRKVADALSSSPVRCGGRTSTCGVDGPSQPTEEGAARTTGGGGLSRSSARTPTDRTAEVPRFKFLRRCEDDAARD